jgi:hypothetical protein
MGLASLQSLNDQLPSLSHVTLPRHVPAHSWDFLSWITEGWHIDFYEKAAAVCLFFRGVTLAMDWSTGTPIFKTWATRKKKKVCAQGLFPQLNAILCKKTNVFLMVKGETREVGAKLWGACAEGAVAMTMEGERGMAVLTWRCSVF